MNHHRGIRARRSAGFAALMAGLLASVAASRTTEAGCVTQAAAAKWHTCAVRNDGTLWCWGDNFAGKLGDGTTVQRLVPVPVTALGSGVAEVAGGDAHTCARKTDGTLWCWGDNDFGQLGDGTNTDRSLPVQLTALGNQVAAVALGDLHTCARKTDGTLWCWGSNKDGELGDGTGLNRNSPVAITGVGGTVADIALGSGHTCVRRTDGALLCWGWNDFGQVGDGTFDSKLAPVPVQNLSAGVAGVAAGEEHTCAILSGGSVRCWGYNDFGQLGDGTDLGSEFPVVAGLTGVRALRLGAWHSCAVKTDNTQHCWGYNGFGQFGDGTDLDSLTPVAVGTLGNRVREISTYSWHTCAIETGGTLWCSGDNGLGQLGDGTTTGRLAQTAVPGICPAAVPAMRSGSRLALAFALGLLALCSTLYRRGRIRGAP